MLDIAGQSPCRVDGNVRVIAVYFHAKGNGCVCNLCTDGTQAYHAKLLAFDFAAGKGFLGLLRGFSDVCVVFVLFAPFDTAHDITGCQEQSGQHQLFYAVCVGTRSVKHHNTFLGAGI